MGTILEASGLTKKYGALVALDRVDMAVQQGEILGLIGPNGSGKSTFFNVVSGVSPATAGNITFNGAEITHLKPHQIAERGLARTFQKTRPYTSVSVLKNVTIGAHCRTRTGVLGAIFRPRWVRDEECDVARKADSILDLLSLSDRKNDLAGRLPLGQRKLLEIARALASDPVLLMVDEPAAGLNYSERRHLVDVLRNLRGRGQTIILVEHSMEVVMEVTDRIVVLNYGKKIFDGLPQVAKKDPAVISAYLGEEQTGA